jgi:hypothetical protein
MASAPPRSRRGKILQNLQRQLETITVDNGYANSVVKVTTNVKNWADTPEAETPIIYIVDDNTDYNYHAGKTVERSWFVDLYGVMKNKEQVDLEEFIADVEECLTKNQTLAFPETGGIVSHIRIKNIVTDGQLFSEIEGSQLFKVTLQINYIACVTDIR